MKRLLTIVDSFFVYFIAILLRKKRKSVFFRRVTMMSRKRKYDYSDLPITIFVKIPQSLKENLDEIVSNKEINEIILMFLREYVEKSRKKD